MLSLKEAVHGVAHLKALMQTYPGNLEKTFAAYNAGGSRVERWSRKAGASDPEVFVERIPYEETRDYVRILLRNRDLYESLYDLLVVAILLRLSATRRLRPGSLSLAYLVLYGAGRFGNRLRSVPGRTALAPM